MDKKLQFNRNPEIPKSPLDLWRLMGGRTQRVKTVGTSQDSLLAVYKDRLTYTFILADEVASIHFDRGKKEIFFKGHNIKNLELNAEQLGALKGLIIVLSQDQRGKEFLASYQATLDNWLADNSKRRGR